MKHPVRLELQPLGKTLSLERGTPLRDVLFAQGVRLRGWRGIWTQVRASPALLFCFVLTVSLWLGTGLSSPNLGTLSRYRTPMMPFFFALLLLLRFREQTANSRPALAPLRPVPNLKP